MTHVHLLLLLLLLLFTEVSVIRAEKQKSVAEKKYTEVACTNRHIGVQKLEEEVHEDISNDSNKINLLKVTVGASCCCCCCCCCCLLCFIGSLPRGS